MTDKFYLVIETCPYPGPPSFDLKRALRRINVRVWLADMTGRAPQNFYESTFTEKHPEISCEVARQSFCQELSDMIVMALGNQLDKVLPLTPEPRQELPTLPEPTEQESR